MNETYNFLKERTKFNFVSTIDGERPSCRPFGDPVLIIATLHDISLLDCKKMFRKEQIWFTDKNDNGTELYSLRKFSYDQAGARDTKHTR